MLWKTITGYCGFLTSPFLLGAGRRIRYTLLSERMGIVMLQREGQGNGGIGLKSSKYDLCCTMH